MTTRTVHPASRSLLNESGHIEAEAGEHDLHAFEALRRMDEILVANFMLFDEVIRADMPDLVVGDEAWEVDYFLHENPELKRFASILSHAKKPHMTPEQETVLEAFLECKRQAAIAFDKFRERILGETQNATALQ